MENSVVLSNLTTGYKNKVVMRDVDAAIQSGRLTCLLGPNGAGKSTLLKTLCAFIPPIHGDIEILGRSLRHMSARDVGRAIGVVLTERPSAMDMTVTDLVGLGRSPYTGFWGSLSEADREIIADAIRRTKIENLAQRQVATLSDGERQKAMIAKTLAQQTPIIFLDEPTAFLDYPSKVDLLKMLYNLAHDEGKTVFLSTHDIDLAIQIADTLWLLDSKRGLEIGSPRALADSGVISVYFSNPHLTFDPRHLIFRVTNPF